MLNELYRLSRMLEGTNISTKDWNDRYKLIPKVTTKAPCIRIWLAADGTICDIERIGTELAQSLRKFGNNQGTFPALNIAPLYRLTDKEQISELEQIQKEHVAFDLDSIRSWCVNNNWKDSLIKKVNRSLHTISQSMLDLIGSQEHPEYTLISKLVGLADGFSDEPDTNFKSALERCIFMKLQEGGDVNLFLDMLFHKGDSNKITNKEIENDTGTLSIILDLFDWQQYGHTVASTYTTEWINEMLVMSERLDVVVSPANGEKDAFGSHFVNLQKPMPNVKLSGFDVTLRSMFVGQPCQNRYQKIGDDSYHISAENRALVKQSLEWIADPEREGITWQKVDKREIIFVYPSKLPEIMPRFASIFGTSNANSSTLSESRFESIAEKFIKALKGIPIQEKPDSIQLFVIRKLDKARSKVVFTRSCTSEQLICAAENWERGCYNIPETNLGERIAPFPLQTACIVNNSWKQNGELAQGKTLVERVKYYQGTELLLDTPQVNTLANYLHILLTNSSGLVNYVGNLVNGGFISNAVKKRLGDLKRQTTLVLSVLGLILYKHNDRKETYMESMAYLVGQLLKISDELHALYCNIVRGENGMPTQLVGSALFVTASESPNQAIAQISVRMNPYITWAKQYRTKKVVEKEKESWRAGWYLKLYEDTANRLLPVMTDAIRFSDFDKAQLFIGYLGAFPKRSDSAASEKIADDITINAGGSNNE